MNIKLDPPNTRMKRLLVVVLLASVTPAFSQGVRMAKLDDILRLITTAEPSTPIQVINFWATWCAPCIKELPYFEGISTDGVRVTLVSLDLDLDPNPAKVHKFVERKGMRSEVLILDERNPNSYIDKIDQRWSGALPATLIVNHVTGERVFIERSLREGELEQLINNIQ